MSELNNTPESQASSYEQLAAVFSAFFDVAATKEAKNPTRQAAFRAITNHRATQLTDR